ncbi:MAG: 2-C-methyl-D-erythritol 4-phosphate cytidylyltransferase [Litorivicinaceae bacterium]
MTDEAQAMEAEGSLPWLIRGRRSNIKLTYPEDMELIEALLTAREERSA